MEQQDNFEQNDIPPRLRIEILDSTHVLVTEHNISKDPRKFPELYEDTKGRVVNAIKAEQTNKIPPIVVLSNPFDSVEKTVEAYRKFIKVHPRRGSQHYGNEKDVLNEIINLNPLLLCYNGNRRLEGFRVRGFKIRAYVIRSQEEFNQIPQEERRIPERIEDEDQTRYQIDQNYCLSFLLLLDGAVYITAQERYYRDLDTSEALKNMWKRRERKKKR